MNWPFHFNISRRNYSLRKRFLFWIEKLTGYRIGENKNYKLI
jgi:hypothetical protein